MQIERKGAANYRHATFARHALRGVLAKVMQKVDDDLGDDPADWDDNILASTNISATLDTTYAQVLTYEAIKNLPGAIQRAIRERYQWEQMGGKYVTPNAPQWIPLLLQRSDVDIRGRFAYAIIDISDMLDINYVGGDPRGPGSSPRELILHDLPGMQTPGFEDNVGAGGSTTPDGVDDDVNAIDFFRERDGGYVTLAESRPMLLPKGNVDGGMADFFAWFNTTESDNDLVSKFTTYSNYPLSDPEKPPLALPSDIDELIGKKTEIEARLLEMYTDSTPEGFYAEDFEAALVFKALIDFIDTDDIPGNLGDPSTAPDLEMPNTERLLMINEIAAGVPDSKPTIYHDIATDVFTLAPPAFSVEYAFPYIDIGLDPENEVRRHVDVYAKVTLNGTTTPLQPLPIMPRKLAHSTDATYFSSLILSTPYATLTGAQSGDKVIVTYYIRAYLKDADGNWIDVAPAIPGNATKETPSDSEVEKHFFRFVYSGTVATGAELTLGADDIPAIESYEALDPRYNWLCYYDPDSVVGAPRISRVKQSLHWSSRGPGENSILEINKRTEELLRGSKGPDNDHPVPAAPDKPEIPKLVVANGGELLSPGEMGCLPFSSASDYLPAVFADFAVGSSSLLKTIRLFDHDDGQFRRHKVFKHFTMEGYTETTRGKVNLTSKDEQILNTALGGFPVNFDYTGTKYFGTKPGETSEDIPISELYSAVTNVVWTGQGEEHYGDIDKIDWLSLYTTDTYPDGDSVYEVTRESIFSATRGLLGSRQQLFAVLMRADAFTSTFGMTSVKQGTVLATTHGTAIIWRDAMPDDKGIHPMKLLYFLQSSD